VSLAPRHAPPCVLTLYTLLLLYLYNPLLSNLFIVLVQAML